MDKDIFRRRVESSALGCSPAECAVCANRNIAICGEYLFVNYMDGEGILIYYSATGAYRGVLAG